MSHFDNWGWIQVSLVAEVGIAVKKGSILDICSWWCGGWMDVGSSWMLNDGRWSIGVVATTPPI
jgi:hypothetical protein